MNGHVTYSERQVKDSAVNQGTNSHIYFPNIKRKFSYPCFTFMLTFECIHTLILLLVKFWIRDHHIRTIKALEMTKIGMRIYKKLYKKSPQQDTRGHFGRYELLYMHEDVHNDCWAQRSFHRNYNMHWYYVCEKQNFAASLICTLCTKLHS